MKHIFRNTSLLLLSFSSFLSVYSTQAATNDHSLEIALGKLIFEDKTLSNPEGQACASCHIASQGHAQEGFIVSPGANSTLFGNRNAPSISYASLTSDWHFNHEDETWIGGFFLDGRATTLQEQAKGPFLNPLEMGNRSKEMVINKIKKSPYINIFKTVYGDEVLQNTDQAFDAMASALAIYQASDSFAQRFTSKYDAYLQGKTRLSKQEQRGLTLFEAEDKGNCAACHPSQIGENGELPLFTDFSYDNLGVPRQINSPFYGMNKRFNPAGSSYVDTGLATNPNIKKPEAQLGKFKVPTLRNIAQTAPYMHNGVFATLTESVDFYNSRDVDKKWAAPEVATNVNKDELGNLQLSQQEVEDIVAFLHTLDDGYIIE